MMAVAGFGLAAAAGIAADRAHAAYRVTPVVQGSFGGSHINAYGHVAGVVEQSDTGAVRAFFWDGEKVTFMPADGPCRFAQPLDAGLDDVLVGIAGGSCGTLRPARWHGGTLSLLPPAAGVAEGLAFTVNPAGQIGGCSYIPVGALDVRYVPVVWEGGTARVLPALTTPANACPVHSPARDFFVGWSQYPGRPDVSLAVAWRRGRIHRLGTLPGDRGSQANAANGSGEIVGFSFGGPDNGKLTAVLFRDGRVIPIADERTGERAATAGAINKHGTVIGSAAFGPYLWRRGVLHDLNDRLAGSGWTLLTAEDINNAGQIVGTAEAPDGTLWQVRLTPRHR